MTIALATEAADLAAVTSLYRLHLAAAAVHHALRGHARRAWHFHCAAEEAARLAGLYAERALFLASVRATEVA